MYYLKILYATVQILYSETLQNIYHSKTFKVCNVHLGPRTDLVSYYILDVIIWLDKRIFINKTF